MGHLGEVWDVPELLRTLGWDGQWDWSHLSRDMSGMSLGVPGLQDGMDGLI